MSTDGSTLLKWPDDERRYRLGIGELRELQDKTDAGPAEIFRALSQQTWKFDYVRETIRLGLIGGGASAQQALAIVGRYVVPGQLMVCAGIAQAVLYAALVGDPNDAGKEEAGTEPSRLAGTTSRHSTEAEQSSGGHPETSINAHSPSSRPQ